MLLHLLWGSWAIHHVPVFFYICTCYCTQRILRRGAERAKYPGPKPKFIPHTRLQRAVDFPWKNINSLHSWDTVFHWHPEVWQSCSNPYSNENCHTVRGSGGSWCDRIRQKQGGYFGTRHLQLWLAYCTSNDVRLHGHLGNQQRTQAEIAKKAEFPWLTGLCNAVQYA